MGRRKRFKNGFAYLFCGCWRRYGDRTSSRSFKTTMGGFSKVTDFLLKQAYGDNRQTEIHTEVIPDKQVDPGNELVLKAYGDNRQTEIRTEVIPSKQVEPGNELVSKAYGDNRQTEIRNDVIHDKQVVPGNELVLKLASEYIRDDDCSTSSTIPSVLQESAMKRGLYSHYYNTLNFIGKGGNGIVKMAERKTDNQQVVVKFIRRKIPRGKDLRYNIELFEFNILRKLNHPNIVKVLDAFVNTEWTQLVMEKHGIGIDLYEFTCRRRKRNEQLESYIFRQMVSAVSYLHSKNILHRDIKSENMIINEEFQIKLIDFGSAAFLQPGKRFAKHCGTRSFWSPEVFLGESYEGPEVEVWALGVTLYELVFGKLPFDGREETLKSVLDPPYTVSNRLIKLLSWMLNPDVNKRATVPELEKNDWVVRNINIAWFKWAEIVPDNDKVKKDSILSSAVSLTSNIQKDSPTN